MTDLKLLLQYVRVSFYFHFRIEDLTLSSVLTNCLSGLMAIAQEWTYQMTETCVISIISNHWSLSKNGFIPKSKSHMQLFCNYLWRYNFRPSSKRTHGRLTFEYHLIRLLPFTVRQFLRPDHCGLPFKRSLSRLPYQEILWLFRECFTKFEFLSTLLVYHSIRIHFSPFAFQVFFNRRFITDSDCDWLILQHTWNVSFSSLIFTDIYYPKLLRIS